jgi:multidrug efflux pump subunit AcrB
MATDIFPEINIPVVSIIWNYTGLPAEEMGQRISGQVERGLTTTVSDIEHIESQSLAGIVDHQGVLPARRQHPDRHRAGGGLHAGAGAPVAAGHHAAAGDQVFGLQHPVVQLALSSPVLPEQSLFDSAVNVLRPQLITVPGAAVPFPYGGKNRLISVDLDTAAAGTRPLATDVVNAVNRRT